MNSTSTKSARATFTVPAETFQEFSRYVPARQRSGVVAAMMAEEVARREAALIAACDAANADPETQALIADFQAFDTPIEEPWED